MVSQRLCENERKRSSRYEREFTNSHSNLDHNCTVIGYVTEMTSSSADTSGDHVRPKKEDTERERESQIRLMIPSGL